MKIYLYITVSLLICLPIFAAADSEVPENTLRKQAAAAHKNGNYKEAFELYEQLCLNADTDPKQVGNDLTQTVECLIRLKQFDGMDNFLEKAIAAHSDNWRLLSAAARSYNHSKMKHYGAMMGGVFRRGDHQGVRQYLNSSKRDRVRALQLMEQAIRFVDDEPDREAAAHFYFAFAGLFYSPYTNMENTRQLVFLTDLKNLPDYEITHYRRQDSVFSNIILPGAPVDVNGNPVFHRIPEKWETAKTDGERWRWLLNKAATLHPNYKSHENEQIASFSYHQFGVHTLAPLYGSDPNGRTITKKDPFGIRTLGEDETIARLTTGVKRFKLPEEFNYIKNRNFTAYFSRGQYIKAAECLKNANGFNSSEYFERITGNWGVFEPVPPQAHGKRAMVDYRFRNGRKVFFEAYALKMEMLLQDIKNYIKSNPKSLPYYKTNLFDIGYRIIQDSDTQYIGKQAAQWSLNLNPESSHFDKVTTVVTPLKDAGIYLLKARMENGNESRIIIWVNDTIIVRKPLNGKVLYYVADAETGAPVANAAMDFFRYSRRPTTIEQFSKSSDSQGQVILSEKGPNQQSEGRYWLVIARTGSGRFAHLGFDDLRYRHRYPLNHKHHQSKTYVITDRPVYRPGQTVQFNAWSQRALFDVPEQPKYANRSITVRIYDSKRNKIYDQGIKSDMYGGISGEFRLPEDAAPGTYRVDSYGDSFTRFQVEEYKKPEFKVSIKASSGSVKEGEPFQAEIAAEYYFGAPVAGAEVKYRVLRYPTDERWYPSGQWDWLYDKGYDHAVYAYKWYPGWFEWGCPPPPPRLKQEWHYPRKPELVMGNETITDPDGTVTIPISNVSAMAFSDDLDYEYEITAEVTEASRRTIITKTTVPAARHSFNVYVQVDRGYYKTNETVTARFTSRTPDDKPVSGHAKAQMYSITYVNGEPKETPIESWDVIFGNKGSALLKTQVLKSGQYRLACTLTDAKGVTREGAHIFTVLGKRSDNTGCRFNDLELIPDRITYNIDETVRLLINTNRPNSRVLLFLRPVNGVYDEPIHIDLTGKSAVYEIPVTPKDIPNFFVEAVTVTDGLVHTQVQEIRVLPENRILNLSVIPSAERYEPGQQAEVRVKLTDSFGKPFVGSTVLTVYDAALEYFSGGSNVPDIRSFFWKWQRHHTLYARTSISRIFHPLYKKNERKLEVQGILGQMVGGEGKFSSLLNYKKECALASRMPPPPPPGYDSDGAPSEKSLREAAAIKDIPVALRTQFADTAFWTAGVTTDDAGEAVMRFTMPENLTGWKIRAWAMGPGTRVGQAEAYMVTDKDLKVRLQSPRFFVEKDEAVLSANIHNDLTENKNVQAGLELDGTALSPLDALHKTVSVEGSGEARADWRVRADRQGEAVVRMKAAADTASDGMEMRYPVYVHGMEKTVPFCGTIRPEYKWGIIPFSVPKERRADTTRLEVRWSPTLAGAMVDALPYLVQYPFGSTENTLNRFLPALILSHTLKRLGIDLASIKEKRINLITQEIGDDSKRVRRWKQYKQNPVFDPDEIEKMVKKGVKKLAEMQFSDGSWEWFSRDEEISDPFNTAIVIHGLLLAEKHGVNVEPDLLKNGIRWLKDYQQEQIQYLQNRPENLKINIEGSYIDNLAALIFSVLTEADAADSKAKDIIFKNRKHLSLYGKSLLGMGLHRFGDMDKRDLILQDIGQYLAADDENQTAWLRINKESSLYRWYDREVETHAAYLKLLCLTKPEGDTAPRLIKYLLNNRKYDGRWNSTKDTALVIEAFSDYLSVSGEAWPDMVVEILLDGKQHKQIQITPENLFSFDNKLIINDDELAAGKHTLELHRMTGKGPVYYNAYLSYYSKEDFISKAGMEIKVNRQFYKLEKADKTAMPADGRTRNQAVEEYQRLPLENHTILKSGDIVEVELGIESKNDYEYVVIEDMKAAGFEPMEVQSGYVYNGIRAFMELHDEKAVFFLRTLPHGNHHLFYRIRAEIPGKFSALPAKAYAMYAPELRANSDEMQLGIQD